MNSRGDDNRSLVEPLLDTEEGATRDFDRDDIPSSNAEHHPQGEAIKDGGRKEVDTATNRKEPYNLITNNNRFRKETVLEPGLKQLSARFMDNDSSQHTFRPAFLRNPTSMRSLKVSHKASARSRKLPWIVIDNEGKRSCLFADKRSLISRAGLFIPPRDTRLLDLSLAGNHQSTILVRDNAIIAAIEHVRLCVTADHVILPREGAEMHPLAAHFVDVLEEAILDWVAHCREYEEMQERVLYSSQEEKGTSGASVFAENEKVKFSGTSFTKSEKSSLSKVLSVERRTSSTSEKLVGDMRYSKGGSDFMSDSELEDSSSHGRPGELPPLPFELVVLEAALKEILSIMIKQTKELEGVAVPALDSLMRSVSSSNLERVRRVKTRHQRLLMRCEALRDELQRFLQDDEDMARMCLTRRKEAEDNLRSGGNMQRGSNTGLASQDFSPAVLYGTQDLSMPTYPASLPRRAAVSFGRTLAGNRESPPHGTSSQDLRKDDTTDNNTMNRYLPVAGNLTASALAEIEAEADAEAQLEVENLLESYYMEVDALYDKLKSLGEYAEDTEEYIDIELDSSRNRLIRIEIVLTLATFCIVPWNLLAGILGENLPLPDSITESVNKFFVVNAIAALLCLGVFYSVIFWMRRTKLL